MEGTCAVETGLLKKKPCGAKAVSQCANCEIGLCTKHAVGQMSGGRKVFLCAECAKAWKAVGDVPTAAPVKKPDAPAAAPKPAAAAPVAKAATPPKPAAKPAAVAAKPAAKEEKKEEHKPDDDAPLEFTPTKK